MNKTKVIGITGSIGSGKTSVAKYIESIGHTVIYTDKLAKEIMSSDGIIRSRIIKLFGDEAYISDNPNTSFIASKVFGDSEENIANMDKLNAIVHPAVIDQMLELTEKYEAEEVPFVFIESALIFELDLEEGFDYIITVNSPAEQCIERVMKRDSIDKKAAEKRLLSQMSPEQKRGLADFVIDNKGTIEDLKKATDLILMFL